MKFLINESKSRVIRGKNVSLFFRGDCINALNGTRIPTAWPKSHVVYSSSLRVVHTMYDVFLCIIQKKRLEISSDLNRLIRPWSTILSNKKIKISTKSICVIFNWSPICHLANLRRMVFSWSSIKFSYGCHLEPPVTSRY